MESREGGNLYPFEKGTQKISVCDDILNMKSDSFRVDMEPFSHLTNYNPRFNLQRSLSRKGSQMGESVDNEKDAAISSPKDKMCEKLTPVTVVATEQQLHHQISITTGGNNSSSGTPTKSRLAVKRSSSFKQTCMISPRRILFFFASLSSMGTILLIYFTLSMAKRNQEDKLLN